MEAKVKEEEARLKTINSATELSDMLSNVRRIQSSNRLSSQNVCESEAIIVGGSPPLSPNDSSSDDGEDHGVDVYFGEAELKKI